MEEWNKDSRVVLAASFKLSFAKTLLGFEIKSLEPIVAALLHVLRLDHVPTPKTPSRKHHAPFLRSS